MSTVLHKPTGMLIERAHTPDYLGNSEYIVYPTAEDIAAYPPPPAPPGWVAFPERAAVYADILTLCAQAGITDPPADYDTALQTLEAWYNAAADLAELKARQRVINQLSTRRVQMLEHHWPWHELLAFAAAMAGGGA